MELIMDPRIQNILDYNNLEPTVENIFMVQLMLADESEPEVIDESQEEYVPAENVSVENGKNADKDTNDTVYDAPAKTPESEQTHSISVGEAPEILEGIDTVDVADLGCIMIDTETLSVLEHVENGEDDLVFETDARDHTMGAVAETEAHVTLLFGLLENGNLIKKNVDAALSGWNTPELKIAEVEAFETNPDHNVIVARIEKTPELVDGHERLLTLPNRQTFSEYKPHLTLAYIKKDADVQKWVKALGEVYNGKTIAATGINYGDAPEEDATGTNPKVIRSIIEIEKKTHSLLNAYEHDGHTHAIDPSLLADVNVLQLQNDINSADQAYAQRYIKSIEEAEPIPPEEGSLLFEAIVAAIVLYYTAKGLALLKPTLLKLGKELPRSPRITVQDIQPLASEIANLVAESHSETIKNDVASISLKLAAGRKLKEIADNKAELARFIPEMRRLTNERLTGRSKLVALNEATRAANKLSIFAAEQFEKENNVKIKKRLRSSTGSPCPECAKIIARTAAKPIPLKQSYVKNFKFDKPIGGNIHVSCACYSEFLVNGKIVSSFDPVLHPRVISGKRGGQFRKKLGINPSVKVKYAHASPTAFNNYNVPSLFTQKMPQHDEDSVNFFRKRIQRGLPIPPISVQKAEDGSLTIGDGYHRMRAFYLENRQPNIVEVKSKDESYQLTQDWIEQNSWWNIIPKSLQEKPTDSQLLALADNVPSTDQETVFQALYTLLGYNEKPTVLSSNEFDGISGTEWTTARGKAKYYDAFRNDDEHYVSDLPTVYGPGTYFADDTGRASEYAGKDVNTVLAAKLPDDMPLLPADEGFDSQSYTDKRLRELSLIALAMAASASTDEEKDFYRARSEKLKDLRMINRLSLSSTLMGYPGIYVDNDTKNTTVANYLVVNDRGSLLVRADDKEFRAGPQATVRLTIAGGKKADFPAKYYRMGRPPESGYSKNHATGELEAGTSVFKGYTDPTTGKTTIDALHDQNELTNGKRFYEVTGEVLEDNGSDGEVLLKPGTAKIVQEIDPATVVTDNNPDYNLLGDDVSEEFETFPVLRGENAGQDGTPTSNVSENTSSPHLYNNRWPDYNMTAPEGYTILYTNTKSENIDAIMTDGLKVGLNADGYRLSPEEGNQVWTDTRSPGSMAYGGNTVAFKVKNEEAEASKVNDTQHAIPHDIAPEDIMFVDKVLKSDSGVKVSNLPEYIEKFGEEKFITVAAKTGDGFSEQELRNLIAVYKSQSAAPATHAIATAEGETS